MQFLIVFCPNGEWLITVSKKKVHWEIFYEALQSIVLTDHKVDYDTSKWISIHVETIRTDNRNRSLSLMNSDQLDNVS